MRQASSSPDRYTSLHVTLVIVGFFALWQIGVLVTNVPEYILPTPTAIAKEFLSAPYWYLDHTLRTIVATLLGFLAALVVGCIAAIGILYSRILEKTLYTLLVALNSVPKIALAPLFIIWMGTGLLSKVAISFLIALFVVVVDTVLGLRSVDPDAVDLFRSMRSSGFQMLRWLRMPNALPHFFAAMKVAISLALVGAIAGEFVASEAGLGYVILSAQGAFQTTRVFAAIVLLGVLGAILFFIVELLERIVCPWHVSQRKQNRAEQGAT
ncbi:MAG TPA: ABC transporter permease [Burkholderiales bacterium]|jgi:NitT/TauT family transport system permease protein|nr:ABC transporter permease [Burkholderiales bacterium]